MRKKGLSIVVLMVVVAVVATCLMKIVILKTELIMRKN